jgi:hypothetical protein
MTSVWICRRADSCDAIFGLLMRRPEWLAVVAVSSEGAAAPSVALIVSGARIVTTEYFIGQAPETVMIGKRLISCSLISMTLMGALDYSRGRSERLIRVTMGSQDAFSF